MTPSSRSGRVDAFFLAGAPLIALGFARFCYALILPSMRADLGLSYGRAGLLGTANTGGYLIGCIGLPLIVRNRSVLGVFRIGVVVTVVGIAATGFTRNYIAILGARSLAGFGGAAAFILGSALAASIATREPDSVVVFNAGAGVGIVIGAAALPPLLASHPERWPVAWFVLSAFAIIAAAAAMSRRMDGPRPSTVAPSFRDAVSGRPSLRWLTASYVCFGTGYIVFVTFLVSTLRARGASVSFTSTAFVVFGFAAAVSPRLWSAPLADWPTRRLMSYSLVGQGVAAALLAASRQPLVVLVSVAVFGSMFLMTPAIVTITVRRERPEHEWTSTIGAITALFAIGQALAPWVSGVLIDHLGTGAGPLWTATFSFLGAWLATRWTRSP